MAQEPLTLSATLSNDIVVGLGKVDDRTVITIALRFPEDDRWLMFHASLDVGRAIGNRLLDVAKDVAEEDEP